MRFSRVAWGIVAGAVALAAVFVVQALETRFCGSPTRASLWAAFIGAGGAVLWLADRLGMLAPPYAEPTLGLGQDVSGQGRSATSCGQAEALLAAFEAGCLFPPCDVHHSGAWDDYWKNQLKFGAMEQSLADDMASDATLPGLLSQRGARTILCAGNGLSSEPVALALYGFDVTALDSSAVPAEAFGRTFRNPEHPVRRIPGFVLRDDGSMTFGPPGLIDPALCPHMHRSADHPHAGGGSVSFITGDLTNPDVCPGPFDVVIERRTLQLFPEVERIAALDRLVARLADRGVFVSHQHARGWRPGEARTHHAAAWLESRGFALRSGTAPGESASAARLAYLMFSSG